MANEAPSSDLPSDKLPDDLSNLQELKALKVAQSWFLQLQILSIITVNMKQN
jgi:hypothetical protein